MKNLVEAVVNEWFDKHVDMIRHHNKFPKLVSLLPVSARVESRQGGK
jgi:hypothetical protein